MIYHPTVSSYFSGGGALDHALEEAGLRVVQSLEIEPIFAETLRRNFGHRIITQDISTMQVLTQERTDVMVFTYPCKKYSTIADIHGTRTGDELYLHALRHIALMQPELYLLENVPGMKKFPIVMEAMSKLPNYYVTVFCPIDANLWLPQNRPRLILFGSRKPFQPQYPFMTQPLRLKDILEKEPHVDIPDYVYKRLNGKYRDKPIISDPERGDRAPTCVAHYAKDRSTRLVVDKNFAHGVRPYTVREYARLQGFPDSFQFAGNENQQLTQIGNAVAVPVGKWAGNEIMRYFN